MNRRFISLWISTGIAALALLWLFYSAFMLYHINRRHVWGLADDVYISACYARSLASGNGLVWFPGDARVEGISNPLWVFLLAVFHKLPGFKESRLGLWIMLTQSLLIAGIFALFWRCFRNLCMRNEAATGMGENESRLSLALPAALTLGAISLIYWMAEGYEVGLIALLALAAFHRVAAQAQATAREAALVGALAAVAGWTRMDGPLYFAAAGLMLLGGGLPWRRKLAHAGICAGVAALLLGAAFLARHAYYHQWLPNTYHLKIKGWPLADRLQCGLRQNWPLLPAVALAWAPLAVPAIRRRLAGALLPVCAALAVFTLAVLYSTHNGGDAWGLKLGYDRFASIGGLFLVLALAVVVERLGRTPRARAAIFTYAALVAALPLALDARLPKLLRETVRFKSKRYETIWIKYGMSLEKITRPGARIALQPAGAIIYFSHRGGLDLLGKCEPYVANMPVNAPDRPPGHNKQYIDDLLLKKRPEISRKRPPEALEPLYRGVSYKGDVFFVRRDSRHVIWEKTKPADLMARVASHTIPPVMKPGQRLLATVTMLNSGDQPWTRKRKIRLAVLEDPRGLAATTAGRAPLEEGQTVAGGQKVTFHLRLEAPKTPGPCPLKFRMVEENVEFFGQSTSMTVNVRGQ